MVGSHHPNSLRQAVSGARLGCRSRYLVYIYIYTYYEGNPLAPVQQENRYLPQGLNYYPATSLLPLNHFQLRAQIGGPRLEKKHIEGAQRTSVPNSVEKRQRPKVSPETTRTHQQETSPQGAKLHFTPELSVKKHHHKAQRFISLSVIYPPPQRFFFSHHHDLTAT